MMKNVIIEIDGNKHQLTEGAYSPCGICSLYDMCLDCFPVGMCVDLFGGSKNSYFKSI